MQEFIQWDVKNWSKALRYWDANINWNNVETCLELGGKMGGLSLWLALKNKTVICSDVSETKRYAIELHSKYPVSAHIEYMDIDATSIPFENSFDIIVFKSILGVIGKNNNRELQFHAMNQIFKALKPGGKLIFAENLSASSLHRYLRRKFVSWGSMWRYVSLEEMKNLLKVFKSADIKTAGVISLFGRNEYQRSALAAIDQRILNHIVPDSWKYISYGIAEK